MLVQFVVSLVAITVAYSTRYFKTTVKTVSGGVYPIPTVRVGTRLEFSGVYRNSSTNDQIAFVELKDDKDDQILLMQLRFNYKLQELGGIPNYFLVSSTIGKDGWADKVHLGKRYAFPMALEDNLEISIQVEVTEGHYEITINGEKSSKSMVNNRPTVEYYRSKTVTVHNTESFTFSSDVLIYTPIGK